MNVQISLGDLGLFILGTALLILIIYGILVLKNAYASIVSIRKIIEKNKEDIELIINKAPTILTDVKDISTRVSGDVKSAQKIIGRILGTAELATDPISKNSDLIIGLIAILQIWHITKNLIYKIPKRKK